MRIQAVVAFVAAAGVAAGVAFAQPEGKRGRRGDRGSHLSEYLGLSAEQQERFKALREEHQKEVQPLRAEGRELHEKLRGALEAKPADEAAVGRAMLSLQEHREKMKASHEAFKTRLRAQLTPEQAQKFDAFEAARRFGRGEGRGRGSRPRGGPGGGGLSGAGRGDDPFLGDPLVSFGPVQG
jgi:Spy/CpxP family protein refolding chaperone